MGGGIKASRSLLQLVGRAILLVLLPFLLAACAQESRTDTRWQPWGQRMMESQGAPREVPGGDPKRGAGAITEYGCGSCHTIPGIQSANAMVGPPLNAFSRRHYIAGALHNTPDNLILWIMDPQAVEPGTAMPNLGVTETEARDIAAYLYTLR